MNTNLTSTSYADNDTNHSQPTSQGHAELSVFASAVSASPSTQVNSNTPLAAPVQSLPFSQDPFLKIKIDSLKRKQRADAFFNSLDDDQSLQLTEWMNETENLSEIHRRVHAPPPDGLGLKVNFSTLKRLRDAWRAEALSRCTDSMFDVISDMEDESDLHQSARVQTAINHLLHEKAFELARTHPGSVVMKDILTSIQKLNELEYKRQKLQLERERLHRCRNQPNTPRHHRVDLNIVPPGANPPPRQPVQIESAPEPADDTAPNKSESRP